MTDQPEGKQFSLKPIETQMLSVINQQMMTIMTNLMSMIAMERLAYNVTEKTRYTLTDNMTKLTIFEEEDKPEEPGVVTEVPKKGKK